MDVPEVQAQILEYSGLRPLHAALGVFNSRAQSVITIRRLFRPLTLWSVIDRARRIWVDAEQFGFFFAMTDYLNQWVVNNGINKHSFRVYVENVAIAALRWLELNDRGY